jgi:hypothetical protein
MKPKADHGEASYVGTARLAGKVALITGATAESGEPSRLHSHAKGQILH